MIQAFLKEKHPDVDRKIRSGVKRRRLFTLYYPELTPKFKPTRDGQERGRRNLAGKSSKAKTRANLIRRWCRPDLPKRIRFGICIVCDKLIMTMNSENPKFHKTCHGKWESSPDGRRYQSLKIQRLDEGAAELLARKRGRPANLKESYSWAIGYYLRDFSFDEIASQNNLSPKSVEDRVKYLIARLPAPHLVSARFRTAIELLLDASSMTPSHLATPVNG
jgi:hypothetical protein